MTSTPDGSCYTSARDIPQDIFLPPSVKEGGGKENQKRYMPERRRDRANRILADVQYRAFAIYVSTGYARIYSGSLTHGVSFAMHNKMRSRDRRSPSSAEGGRARGPRMDSSEGINHRVRGYIFSYAARFKALTGAYTLRIDANIFFRLYPCFMRLLCRGEAPPDSTTYLLALGHSGNIPF